MPPETEPEKTPNSTNDQSGLVADGHSQRPERTKQENFNLIILGWVFVSFSAILIVCIIAFLGVVAIPLTSPSLLYKKVADSYGTRIDEKAFQFDPQTTELLVMLEYSSADIRFVGVQITFAVFAGLFFAAMGTLLLAAGVLGVLRMSGSAGSTEFSLVSTTPGAVCLVLGGAIIIAGILRDTRRDFQARTSRPFGVQLEQRSEKMNGMRKVKAEVLPPDMKLDLPDDPPEEPTPEVMKDV